MKFIISIAFIISALAFSKESQQTLDIAAAASLRESLTEISSRFEHEHNVKVNLTFNASGTLATQIEHGAPADVFISAAVQQVDQLERAGLVLEDSRTIVARNTLVLIAPPTSKLASFDDLKSQSTRRIAIGEPDSVPAGHYAAQALRSLGLFDEIKPRLVFATNVRQVLEYVVRGDVDAGIVYLSDARAAGDGVKICASAQTDHHDPIVYPAVIIKTTDTPDLARSFIQMLDDEKSRNIFASRGFVSPTTQPSN